MSIVHDHVIRLNLLALNVHQWNGNELTAIGRLTLMGSDWRELKELVLLVQVLQDKGKRAV